MGTENQERRRYQEGFISQQVVSDDDRWEGRRMSDANAGWYYTKSKLVLMEGGREGGGGGGGGGR